MGQEQLENDTIISIESNKAAKYKNKWTYQKQR